MKKKKALFAVLLVLILVLAMACSKSEDNSKKDEPTSTEAPTETSKPTEAPATDTPAPTKEAEPTDTPAPTKEAEPTEEITPTEAPEPTAAPEPTDEPEPVAEDDADGLITVSWCWDSASEEAIPDLFIDITDSNGNSVIAGSECEGYMEYAIKTANFDIPAGSTPSTITIMGTDPVTANDVISSVFIEIMLQPNTESDFCVFAYSSEFATSSFKRAGTGIWYYEVSIDWATGDIAGIGTSYEHYADYIDSDDSSFLDIEDDFWNNTYFAVDSEYDYDVFSNIRPAVGYWLISNGDDDYKYDEDYACIGFVIYSDYIWKKVNQNGIPSSTFYYVEDADAVNFTLFDDETGFYNVLSLDDDGNLVDAKGNIYVNQGGVYDIGYPLKGAPTEALGYWSSEEGDGILGSFFIDRDCSVRFDSEDRDPGLVWTIGTDTILIDSDIDVELDASALVIGILVDSDGVAYARQSE